MPQPNHFSKTASSTSLPPTSQNIIHAPYCTSTTTTISTTTTCLFKPKKASQTRSSASSIHGSITSTSTTRSSKEIIYALTDTFKRVLKIKKANADSHGELQHSRSSSSSSSIFLGGAGGAGGAVSVMGVLAEEDYRDDSDEDPFTDQIGNSNTTLVEKNLESKNKGKVRAAFGKFLKGVEEWTKRDPSKVAAPVTAAAFRRREAIDAGIIIKKTHTATEDEELVPVDVKASPIKNHHNEQSNFAFFVKEKNRPHRSSLDKMLDGIYESQSTLGSMSLSSIPDEEGEDEAYDGAPAELETRNPSFSKPPLPGRESSNFHHKYRDSITTVRNSVGSPFSHAPLAKRFSLQSQKHATSPTKKQKIGVDVDSILSKLSPLQHQFQSTKSIKDFPHPLYLESDNYHNQSSSRPSVTARVLMDSRSNLNIFSDHSSNFSNQPDSSSSRPPVASIARARSYTHADSSTSALTSTQQKAAPKKTATKNALDRLGVEYMSCTPYSWWWLSGLSGDSILPDSFGFAEPTFHECTQFNTEIKRPGFKRLVLAPIKKMIGVEPGYRDNEMGGAALGISTFMEHEDGDDGDTEDISNIAQESDDRGSSEFRISEVERRKSVQVFEEASPSDDVHNSDVLRDGLSRDRKSTSTRASLASSPSRKFRESVSFGTEIEHVNGAVQMDTFTDGATVAADSADIAKRSSLDRKSSIRSGVLKKHVLWDPKTLTLGESRVDNTTEDIVEIMGSKTGEIVQEQIEIAGMARIRRRKSSGSKTMILSMEQAAALSTHQLLEHSPHLQQNQDHRTSITRIVAAKQEELNNLNATILQCTAQTGNKNPFVQALIEQRHRIIDELESYSL
ncbi:hypothetical protein BDR26DRAFT_570537 [Obelidium mucronatum]|nr:hypothetical protein BDR26DRAFT_570537 [Obelidium mucronatum]